MEIELYPSIALDFHSFLISHHLQGREGESDSYLLVRNYPEANGFDSSRRTRCGNS